MHVSCCTFVSLLQTRKLRPRYSLVIVESMESLLGLPRTISFCFSFLQHRQFSVSLRMSKMISSDTQCCPWRPCEGSCIYNQRGKCCRRPANSSKLISVSGGGLRSAPYLPCETQAFSAFRTWGRIELKHPQEFGVLFAHLTVIKKFTSFALHDLLQID